MILPGWQVVFSVQPGAILKPLDDARGWLYLVAVGFIGFILIVFFTLSRQLRTRVGSLVEGAHQLSSGDLRYRLAEQAHDDEIGRVTRAFNVMAGRLADVMERTVRAEKLAVLGTFATGVAHEVRNPLATMKTTVQALLRREQESQRRELLSDLCQEIDRLSHVTSDLLEYGRPHPAIPQALDLETLMARTVRLVTPEAEAKGVEFSSRCQAGLQLWVDPDQAQQVLLNLCLNAVEASEAGQAVVLAGQACGERVRVTVVDQGCGKSSTQLSPNASRHTRTRLTLGRRLAGRAWAMKRQRFSRVGVPRPGTSSSMWWSSCSRTTSRPRRSRPRSSTMPVAGSRGPLKKTSAW